VIISRNTQWERHETNLEVRGNRNLYGILVGNQKKRVHLKDSSIDGKITFNSLLKEIGSEI